MKTLHVIRHAKSSWKDPLLSDKNRPLKKRGQYDSVIMSRAIAEEGWQPGALHCSTATRARQTIGEMLDALGESDANIHYDDAMYTFDYRQLIEYLMERTEDELTLVGHNPALHELIEWFTAEPLEKFPTCAYCRLELELENWREFSQGAGKIQTLLLPRMFKQH